ncbi:MAG: chorismate mutase [Treponema sp.]|nr:chorismate mutase [Treponema sp.]
MEKKLFGLRGASGAENTKESIQAGVVEMCRKLFAENNVRSEDIVSVHFTLTKDLNAVNPCFALRHGDVGIDVSQCALFASQEVDIQGSPECMIRVLIHAYLPSDAVVRHCYIRGAERLRPDFAKK